MNSTDDAMHQKALELAYRFIITDGHIDLPWRLSAKHFELNKENAGMLVLSKEGEFDFVRAKKGGMTAPFMSIYVPSSYQSDLPLAKLKADSLIDLVNWMITSHPDKFGRGDSPQLIESNFRKGLVSLPMGLENGVPMATLEDVKYFYDRGIRYVTLTHGKDNHISDSSYDTTHTWGGLSPYGIQLVHEMNDVGIMVDVSHISDEAFYKVMEVSSAPVIASHSSCRYFTPEWERNMSDEMIKLLASKDGVIQINFGSDFLDGDVAKKRKADRAELDQLLKESNLKADDPSGKTMVDEFKKKHPNVYSTVQRVADHMDHVKQLVGIDHIGIGSDFDGVGDSLPTGLKDVSMYPNLIEELLKRGYTEDEIEKICYKNVWRVWNKVIEIAGSK
ncbi:MAG TPA: dipeptidase [Saprospiraceae bacterium]|nr:dipeptidase [Saprospiraceae bacterium]